MLVSLPYPGLKIANRVTHGLFSFLLSLSPDLSPTGKGGAVACSAETSARIDQQVVELVKAQHEKARKILADNSDKLHQLAKYLYEKETITGEEFMAILEGSGNS